MIVRHGYAARRNKDSYQRATNRRAILANASHCAICGRAFKPGDHREADHITPVSAGGSDALSNLRATHRGCNRRRGQG